MYFTGRGSPLAFAAEIRTVLVPVIVAMKPPTEDAQVVTPLAMFPSLNHAIMLEDHAIVLKDCPVTAQLTAKIKQCVIQGHVNLCRHSRLSDQQDWVRSHNQASV